MKVKKTEMTIGKYILIMTFSLLVGIIAGHSCERTRYESELKAKEDSLKIINTQYKSLQAQFREHMSKCALISTYSIQKWNGRRILLYSETNTNRKPYKILNYGNN